MTRAAKWLLCRGPWTETRARRKGRRREGGRDGPPQRGGGRREGPGGEGPACPLLESCCLPAMATVKAWGRWGAVGFRTVPSEYGQVEMPEHTQGRSRHMPQCHQRTGTELGTCGQPHLCLDPTHRPPVCKANHTAQIPPCCRGHPPCTDHPPCINPALLDHPHCSGSRCICPLGNDSSRCGEAVVCLLVLIAPPREAGRQTSVPPL